MSWNRSWSHCYSGTVIRHKNCCRLCRYIDARSQWQHPGTSILPTWLARWPLLTVTWDACHVGFTFRFTSILTFSQTPIFLEDIHEDASFRFTHLIVKRSASVAEWLRAWDTLTMFEATVCGRSWVQSPTGAIYSRMSFSSDQVTGKVFSSEHAFPSKFWIYLEHCPRGEAVITGHLRLSSMR